MAHLVHMSEAASIALHAMVLLAAADRPVRVREMADLFSLSPHHTSKVLQRLSKAGLVRAVRGPGGGFILDTDPATTTILTIYEAVEGRLDDTTCLFREARCAPGTCLFGGMLTQINRIVREHFAPVTLADVAARSPFALPQGDA